MSDSNNPKSNEFNKNDKNSKFSNTQNESKKKKGLDLLLGSFSNENEILNNKEIKNIQDVKDSTSFNQQDIPLDKIIVNRYQPRTVFNEEEIIDLANSIKEMGLISPIVVTPVDDKYEIIAGERRFRAFTLLNKKTIPAIIKKNVSNKDKSILALIENVQRSDLNPIEIAKSYQAMMNTFGLTQEEVAQKVGKKRAEIANYVRILNLSEEVINLIEMGKITFGHAKILAGLKNKEKTKKIAQEIVINQYSIRKLSDVIKKESKVVSSSKPKEDKHHIYELYELKLLKKFKNLNSAKVKRIGKKVVLTLDIPEGDLKKIIEKLLN